MNLLNHLHLSVQAWLDDLFSEEPQLTEVARQEGVEALFSQVQAALKILNAGLAEAIAQNKRVEIERAELTAQTRTLDSAIDDDLRAGLESEARAKSVQLVALKERAEKLSEQGEYSRQAVIRFQSAAQRLQSQLEEARHKRLALSERERLVALLVNLDRLDRELRRGGGLLDERLQIQEAEVLEQEDWLAAREEWKRK